MFLISDNSRILDSEIIASSVLPGLYIHVPFCISKCVYCDFYSITAVESIPQWLAAIEKEMTIHSSTFPRFDSLFIGGGTPSLLDGYYLSSLHSALRDHFSFADNSEITIEVNPDDVDEECLDLFHSCGINRISFGIQSFVDRELIFLKRRHTSAQAKHAIETAIKAGFSNIGLDLIYGIPGQTNADWLATLEHAVLFNTCHISCYQLTSEGETPLKTMIAYNKIHLPSDSRTADLFLLTSRFLKSHGYIHYEVSNFAVEPHFFCFHNTKYWNHTPYLGLGPSAHSFDGTRRWWNYKSLEKYCSLLNKGESPVEEFETLSLEQLRMERIYLGLRTYIGVDLRELPQGATAFVDELIKEGLAKIENSRLILTPKGYLVADSLPASLTP
jgi:oxygen-independent coproporphyrinogen III oxidase